MLKNLKMAGKMFLGFGSVLVIVAVVILITVSNMLSIQKLAVQMENEYVPEVELASQLERDSRATMYAMRGYSLSFDENYYNEAEQTLSRIYQELKDAETLAASSNDLVKLRQNVATVQEHVKEYDDAAAQTKKIINGIIEHRMQLDSSAAEFVKQINLFVASQEKQFRDDLSLNKNDSQMIERMRKIYLVNDINDLGNQARVKAFKAQLYVDYAIVDDALADLKQIDRNISDIRAVTRQQVNLDQLAAVEKAKNTYGSALSDISASYKQLAELNQLRNDSADNVLSSVEVVAAAGLDQTKLKAAESSATIESSIRVIITGFIIALLISIFIAVAITLAITKALGKGVRFAMELADGDLTTRLDVVQKDELGKLADALRDMQNKLREVVTEVRSSSIMVSEGSQQLSDTSTEMSQGATEQAANAEEVSSSLEEMGANVQQNADNAAQTEKIASKAAQPKAERW